MSNNLSCKNTILTKKLFLYYKKRQIYSFPRFGSFRRTLLYLLVSGNPDDTIQQIVSGQSAFRCDYLPLPRTGFVRQCPSLSVTFSVRPSLPRLSGRKRSYKFPQQREKETLEISVVSTARQKQERTGAFISTVYSLSSSVLCSLLNLLLYLLLRSLYHLLRLPSTTSCIGVRKGWVYVPEGCIRMVSGKIILVVM